MSLKKELERQKQEKKNFFRILNAKKHAVRRLKERYHIIISITDLDELSKKIQSGKSVCIGKMSLTRSAHLLEIQGKSCLAIYNNRIRTIVTFMPQVEVWKLEREVVD